MVRAVTLTILLSIALQAERDPGPRQGASLSGLAVSGLSDSELALFSKGRDTFNEVERVANGLGPRFNHDSCGGCHVHPTIGGASPAINPQIAVATKEGGANQVPAFLQADGPVRVVRFRRRPDGTPDGGVHALFVITGRADAPGDCRIQQPDFSRMENLSFRIPTPAYGLGLIEAILDSTLRANLADNADRKRPLGILGRLNTSGNDGTVTRFGWKAQNKSLAIFSGEAYNVEMGITNELFPQEREEDPACIAKSSPEDYLDLDKGSPSDAQMFTLFMRFLAAPPAGPSTPSTERGRALFAATGCASATHSP